MNMSIGVEQNQVYAEKLVEPIKNVTKRGTSA